MACEYLHTKTLKLLKDRKASLKLNDIAIAIGESYAWVQAFSTGKYDSGSIKVQKLYEFLSGEKLFAGKHKCKCADKKG